MVRESPDVFAIVGSVALNVIVPRPLNTMVSVPVPAAQSPPDVSDLLLALSIASRRLHTPSPEVLASLSVLTTIPLGWQVGQGLAWITAGAITIHALARIETVASSAAMRVRASRKFRCPIANPSLLRGCDDWYPRSHAGVRPLPSRAPTLSRAQLSSVARPRPPAPAASQPTPRFGLQPDGARGGGWRARPPYLRSGMKPNPNYRRRKYPI